MRVMAIVRQPRITYREERVAVKFLILRQVHLYKLYMTFAHHPDNVRYLVSVHRRRLDPQHVVHYHCVPFVDLIAIMLPD